MGNKIAKPLSVVLSDAVLSKKRDRDKAVEVIGIYLDVATPYNVRKYFHDVKLPKEYSDSKNFLSIEEFINISTHPIHWNEEYSLIVHFRGGDYEEQYFNPKTNQWE